MPPGCVRALRADILRCQSDIYADDTSCCGVHRLAQSPALAVSTARLGTIHAGPRPSPWGPSERGDYYSFDGTEPLFWPAMLPGAYVSVDLGKALETGVACMVRCFFAAVLFPRGHRVVQSQVS